MTNSVLENAKEKLVVVSLEGIIKSRTGCDICTIHFTNYGATLVNKFVWPENIPITIAGNSFYNMYILPSF